MMRWAHLTITLNLVMLNNGIGSIIHDRGDVINTSAIIPEYRVPVTRVVLDPDLGVVIVLASVSYDDVVVAVVINRDTVPGRGIEYIIVPTLITYDGIVLGTF